LRTPTGKADWLDPIKFVPLNDGGEVYVSFGGDVRETYERFHNPNFGLQPQDPDGYLLQRYFVHADAHTNSHTRIFVEVVRLADTSTYLRDNCWVMMESTIVTLPPQPTAADH